MDAYEHQRMFEHEDRSWWFRARRQVIAAALDKAELPAGARVADIGCGTGGNLPMLTRYGTVTGVEMSPLAAELARSRGLAEVAVGTAESTSLESDSFDLVTMFDVLEHLDDDMAGLAEVRRLLRPAGWFCCTVPAFMLLWSGHDVALEHRRRYRKAELVDRLEAAGLGPQLVSYTNVALFPPVAGVRLLRRLGAKLGLEESTQADGVDVPPAPINAALQALWGVERFTLGKLPAPFGVSLIALSRG